MRLLLLSITAITFTLASMLLSSNRNETNILITEDVVFNGYEGEMYFFTNVNNEAIVIEDAESNLFKHLRQNKLDNDYVGTTFKIILRNNANINSMLTTKSVKKIEFR